eukprot:Skav231343  [mRNA]  locus=scaffold1905:13388:18524:+ [translate_table: standard]
MASDDVGINLEELLKLSLDAAGGAGPDACATEREQVFQILPRLFLASEFGGHGKIPNHFDKCRYINYELVDQPGEDISPAIRKGGFPSNAGTLTDREAHSCGATPQVGCSALRWRFWVRGRAYDTYVFSKCRRRPQRLAQSWPSIAAALEVKSELMQNTDTAGPAGAGVIDGYSR